MHIHARPKHDHVQTSTIYRKRSPPQTFALHVLRARAAAVAAVRNVGLFLSGLLGPSGPVCFTLVFALSLRLSSLSLPLPSPLPLSLSLLWNPLSLPTPPATPTYSHTHESRVRSSMTDTSAGGVGNAKCITCNTKLFAQYCPYDDALRKIYAYEYTM